MNNFHEILINQLAKESSFVTDDGELKKFIIIDAAFNMNRTLIGLLLTKPELKQKFFIEIAGHWVFDINLFVQYMENKNFLKDSYTRYRNKIGLNIGGKFLNQRNEVSLVWPFKDCILEGGQSREDQKRPEIFFNEILAQEEIDQLTEPKVLTHWKRYSIDGEKPVTELKRENGTIKENLIIKGNNLLALYSLLPQFQEKVKLIYIDPPYNTGGDGDTFLYNNSFKHSTWLTFMKNRFDVAKKLIKKDGAIIVAIDENEQARLGLLIEETFSEHENHCITIVHNPRGIVGTNFSYTHEFAYFIIPRGKKTIVNRKIDNGDIEWSNLRNWGTESNRGDAKNCFYPIFVNPKTSEIVKFGDVCDDDEHPESINVKEGELIKIFPIDPSNIEKKWRYARQSVEEIKHLLKARVKSKVWDIEIGKDFGQYKTVWIDNRYDANEYGTKLIKSLVPDCKFSFPKSLYNVYDAINAIVGNDKDAIILDYHAGSGTTAHAVLELNKFDQGNRRFILIEQLDYIENVTNKRVQKVIENNSKTEKNTLFANELKEISFVYCELKKYNQTFMEQIEEAETTKQLLAIWEEMKAHSFLNYNVDIKKHDQAIEDFKQLSIETQKQHLCEILNKNQLYVNLSSIDDEDYQVSEDDKRLTRDFYEIKEEKEFVQLEADL